LSSVLHPRQHSIGYMGDGFYRSKDPTNSSKVLKVHIVHRHKQTWTQNTANPLVHTNMGRLGDGSHRGQGRQAWTVVRLPPRYPPTDLQTLLLLVCAAVGRVKANTALTGEENSADHSGKNQEKNRQQFEISGEQSSALSVWQTASGQRSLNHHLQRDKSTSLNLMSSTRHNITMTDTVAWTGLTNTSYHVTTVPASTELNLGDKTKIGTW